MVSVKGSPVPIHPAQKAYLKSQAYIRGFVGGRGAGKSFIGSHDIMQRAKADRLYMVTAPTYPMLSDSSMRTFRDHFTRYNRLIDMRGSQGGQWAKIKTLDPNAMPSVGIAEVLFRSASDPEKLRGPNMSGIWMDEASVTASEALDIAIACLRQNSEMGWLGMTFTPKGKGHWTYETFYDKAGMPKPQTFLVTSPSKNNPFLPEQFVEMVSSRYTSSMRDQELSGLFIDMSGAIFRREWFPIVDAAPLEASRVRYWDKACLLFNTKVLTKNGEKNIADVIAGDRVMTRAGWRKVRKSWMTKRVDDLVSVLFSNGSAITGTADHRVWTKNRGWQELAAIRETDYVIGTGECRWENEKDRHESRAPKSLSSMESPIAGDQGSDISKPGYTTRSPKNPTKNRSIEQSGSSTAAPYPLVMTFITRKAATTTIRSEILSADRTEATCASIGISGENPATRSSEWLLGYAQTKAKELLSQMAVIATTDCQFENSNANGAQSDSAPSIQEKNSAQRSVASEHRTIGKSIPVYDLEVDDQHEFFANGILVHNSTQDGGCFTAGLLMCRCKATGVFFIEDVVVGQWSPLARNERIKQTALADAAKYNNRVEIWIEQEPGSGGKESMMISARDLAGFPVYSDPPQGDKATRAQPLASQAEAGNVRIINDRGRGGPEGIGWNEHLLDEICYFPEYKFRDQVDAASGAFNKLALEFLRPRNNSGLSVAWPPAAGSPGAEEILGKLSPETRAKVEGNRSDLVKYLTSRRW